MNGEEFSIGDYVKFDSISKGGKKFQTKCIVIDIDDRLFSLLNKKSGNAYNKDNISYTLLSNDNEEYRVLGREIEYDLEEERNNSIDNLFKEDE